MTTHKPQILTQRIIFILSLFLIFAAAFLGWKKLQYGFSFIDEGYHMVEGWRLTEGDHFLEDKLTGTHMLYTIFNGAIFRLVPDITLLGFRKIQFSLTILVLLLFGAATYKTDRQYWYIPLVLAVFAFTGLDPIGMLSNMNYYTYSHLFITTHIAFLIFGIMAHTNFSRRTCLLCSGFSLWAISFNLLHLSLAAASPILLYWLLKKLKDKTVALTLSDLYCLLAPIILCWAVFLCIYNKQYVIGLYTSVFEQGMYSFKSHWTLQHINWEAVGHVIISACYVIVFYFFCTQKYSWTACLISLSIASTVMFFIIDTSYFGLIEPYWNGWFSKPMWLASLYIAFYFLFWTRICKKAFTVRRFHRHELYCMIILLPCTILFLAMAVFSGMGALTILHCSIPTTIALTITILYQDNVRNSVFFKKFLVLLLFFLPFFWTTAWADWKFSYFDVSPELTDIKIEEGFGKGIYTNSRYSELYNWIGENAHEHSDKSDYMISYMIAPMAHMIAKRKPALDDTWISLYHGSHEYYHLAVQRMKQNGREPAIAFIFEGIPGRYPTSLKMDTYQWFPEIYDFSKVDPISTYIKENMIFIDSFQLTKGKTVRCYIQK